jgi:serine protease Do
MKKNRYNIINIFFSFFLATLISILLFSAESFASKKNSKQKTSKIKVENIALKLAVSTGFADIVEELLPAVVNISAAQEMLTNNLDQPFLNDLLPKNEMMNDLRQMVEGPGQGKNSSSLGSGFIISKDGYIVTNFHVISEAREINVRLSDDSKYKARVIGVDKKSDLALLKINAAKDLKFANFGNSDKSRIGDWVIVVGNPFGLGASVSVGIISARSRDINNNQLGGFLQTDAAINQGSSGGPMFNLKGEVIGVSTAIYSPSGSSVGIGFAAPSIIAAPIIRQLREQGEVIRGWLGVSVQDISKEMADSFNIEQKGAFVTDLAENGPARLAGIMPADIIIKFDDQEIRDMKELPRIVAKTPLNKTVKILVLRQGKPKVFMAKITKSRESDNKKIETKPIFNLNNQLNNKRSSLAMLGMGLIELNNNLKKERNIDPKTEGLLVLEVRPKTIAANKAIMPGDIILSVNQIPIKSIEEFKNIINNSKKAARKVMLFIKKPNGNFPVILSVN